MSLNPDAASLCASSTGSRPSRRDITPHSNRPRRARMSTPGARGCRAAVRVGQEPSTTARGSTTARSCGSFCRLPCWCWASGGRASTCLRCRTGSGGAVRPGSEAASRRRASSQPRCPNPRKRTANAARHYLPVARPDSMRMHRPLYAPPVPQGPCDQRKAHGDERKTQPLAHAEHRELLGKGRLGHLKRL